MNFQKGSGVFEIIKKITGTNFRAIFLVMGQFPIFQIPSIHYQWSKFSSAAKKSILWCFKNNKSSLLQKISKDRIGKNGISKNQSDFFVKTKIRYCYHDQTSQILGETFGMCVIENLETITPNVLARTIETVEGGGLIVFLLETKNDSLNLQNISRGIANKFKKSPYKTTAGRFFDVLLFSLNTCSTFFPLDDRLNLCPNFNKKSKDKFWSFLEKEKQKKKTNTLLKDLIQNIKGMEPLSSLVSKTKTFDQARALLTLAEAIARRKLNSTVLLTSGRGRGKSAVLGLAAASAVAYGYANISITAPKPENLHSFFAFLLIGFKALNYIENKDYEIIQNSKYKFIEKILIISTHYQEISFLLPHQIKDKKDQIELLIIDEAAAISEEDFKSLLGSYHIFISSTSSGYEGSGQTLSLKMTNNLKKFHFSSFSEKNIPRTRILKEVILEEPIRYSKNDPVEKWLNDFLFLDSDLKSSFLSGCPDPGLCRLFLVDRNALFSGHKVSKCFLQKIFGLFTSSHYRNSPDDLQLLCDAPSHRILVLIPPFNFSIGFLPDILCAVHISYEGQLSRRFVQKNLLRGREISGDLIPWVISKYYLDPSFAELSGVRIIRIATNPDIQNMGYGTRALYLFHKNADRNSSLKKVLINKSNKKIKNSIDRKISPVLFDLEEKNFLKLDYIGVSFELNLALFGFWQKNGFSIVFLHQKSQRISTGFICIMLKPCQIKKMVKPVWLGNYQKEFFKRFLNLLGTEFHFISTSLVFRIIQNIRNKKNELGLEKSRIKNFLTSFDLNRIFFLIEKNSIGFKIIIDILPLISKIVFWNFPNNFNFSYLENLILLSIGLQHKSILDIKKELSLRNFIILSILKNSLTKFIKNFCI